MKDSFDKEMMLKAIKVGETSRTLSPPNPWVGCIIVKDGNIIAQGATQKPGSHHAEIMALKEAGSAAAGATLYVTLEPCCHYGRTPPCVDAVKKSGIAKVVVALEDPDEKVSGKGTSLLQQAGIEVTTGICHDEAFLSLEAYLYQRKNKRPFLLAKCACSLDGRIAAQDFSSKWISSEAARNDAQELRSQSQAILIGAGTAIHDTPRLTVRNSQLKPWRVILDSKGRVEAKGPLFDLTLAPTLIFTTEEAPKKRVEEWVSTGAEVKILQSSNKGVDLTEMLHFLNTKEVLQVLCEGGGILLGSLFQEKLVNRLTTYVSPCLLGSEGKPMLENFSIPTMQNAYALKYLNSKILDGTMRLDYSI